MTTLGDYGILFYGFGYSGYYYYEMLYIKQRPAFAGTVSKTGIAGRLYFFRLIKEQKMVTTLTEHKRV